MRVIDVATGAITVNSPPFDVESRRTTEFTFGPDGRLYWLTDDGDFAIFDPAANTWTEPTTSGTGAWSVEFSMDGHTYYLFDHDGEHIERFDTATDVAQASPNDDASTIMLTTSLDEGHAEVVTPF
jgi:sugar lactone lactonase YvrE